MTSHDVPAGLVAERIAGLLRDGRRSHFGSAVGRAPARSARSAVDRLRTGLGHGLIALGTALVDARRAPGVSADIAGRPGARAH